MTLDRRQMAAAIIDPLSCVAAACTMAAFIAIWATLAAYGIIMAYPALLTIVTLLVGYLYCLLEIGLA
jgi:hypothetical protein